MELQKSLFLGIEAYSLAAVQTDSKGNDRIASMVHRMSLCEW